MPDMKHFSLLVRVPVTYNKEMAEQVFPQWMQLFDEWKSSGVYVFSFAFPGDSYTVNGPDKTVKKESVLSGNLRVVSNVVIKAESLEAAVKLAGRCPILQHGGSVEVREIVNFQLPSP
jgi:YCII-related domain.